MINLKQRVKNFSLALSSGEELLFVLGFAFGYFFFASTKAMIRVIACGYYNIDHSSFAGLYLALIEILLMCIIGPILYYRGFFNEENSPITFTWAQFFQGIGIFLLARLASGVLLSCLLPKVHLLYYKNTHIIFHYNAVSIVAVCMVNPFYEEFFLLKYLFKRFKSYSPWVTIIISALVRMSYHTYQGWLGVISLFSIGILFGFLYYKIKNLAPFIIAHIIFDFIALI